MYTFLNPPYTMYTRPGCHLRNQEVKEIHSSKATIPGLTQGGKTVQCTNISRLSLSVTCSQLVL